jgi:hypothetical protein
MQYQNFVNVIVKLLELLRDFVFLWQFIVTPALDPAGGIPSQDSWLGMA